MNYTIEKAKQELLKFLDENPELRKYQEVLSKSMDKADEKDRIGILSTFIQYNLSDLQFELMTLGEMTNKLFAEKHKHSTIVRETPEPQ